MNRWTHPIQWVQSVIDRHEAYIKELQKTTAKLKEEIDRLDQSKANRAGRKPVSLVK